MRRLFAAGRRRLLMAAGRCWPALPPPRPFARPLSGLALGLVLGFSLAGPVATAPAQAARLGGERFQRMAECPSMAKTPDSVWAHIRAGLQIGRDMYQPSLQKVLDEMLRQPGYGILTRTSPQVGLLLNQVVDAVAERNLPMDLALLPIVESGYNPRAISSRWAAGLWQFIPATGRLYGLHQNRWYDGRMDITASTYAALNYLKELWRAFDRDWLLALAAYNAGPGTVSRAIAANRSRSLPTDFWSLSLPRETRRYVPKLLALVELLARCEEYHARFPVIPRKSLLQHVDVGTQFDLLQAARMAGMELDHLRWFNAAYKQRVSAPEGPHALLLPEESSLRLNRNLEDLTSGTKLAWEFYRIEPGDTLSEILLRFGTQRAHFHEFNNMPRGREDQIYAGRYLLLPLNRTRAEEYRVAAGQLDTEPTRVHHTVHTVQPGESLWRIARRYRVPVKLLAQWNDLDPNAVLKERTQLEIWFRQGVRIPVPSPSTPPDSGPDSTATPDNEAPSGPEPTSPAASGPDNATAPDSTTVPASATAPGSAAPPGPEATSPAASGPDNATAPDSTTAPASAATPTSEPASAAASAPDNTTASDSTTASEGTTVPASAATPAPEPASAAASGPDNATVPEAEGLKPVAIQVEPTR